MRAGGFAPDTDTLDERRDYVPGIEKREANLFYPATLFSSEAASGCFERTAPCLAATVE